MYTFEQLENEIKCTYPASISPETQRKRMDNISYIQQLIKNSIDDKSLRYNSLEERLHIFTTRAGEKIYIQYPGKESALIGTKYCPYDFRPKIMDSSGRMIRDLVFADMWGLIEDLNSDHHRMLKLLAAIFFRLGRMTLHFETEKSYVCESLDENGNVIEALERSLHWHELRFDANVIESLNYNAGNMIVDEGTSISLEAFLCFFDLLLLNEDSKYYYKKQDLSSGRIPTSDSMLLLASSLFGRIRLSVLLQRFVSGFGVAHCKADEVESATDGLVRIVDRKKELIKFWDDNNISYKNNTYISVDSVKYHAILKTTNPKIAIFSTITDNAKNSLEHAGWNVFDINSLTEQSSFNSIISLYEAHDETP